MSAAIESHPIHFIQRTRPAVRPPTRPADWPVALVCMPFVSVYRPSLQICLLKSLAEQNGFSARTLHLNLDFAHQIGIPLYERMVRHRGRMFGDWLFAQQAFGADTPAHSNDMLDAFPQDAASFLQDLGLTKAQLQRIRDQEVPRYLDGLVDAIAWQDFRIVGFTSTFQQNAASFALARRLKQRHPQLQTIFGGANFDGEMGEELARSIGCIDYAAIGEADTSWPAFLNALTEQRDPAEVPGIVARRNGGVTTRKIQPPLEDLNASPVPNYQEYFDRIGQLGTLADAPRQMAYLPFESSRGCWWGQKHHCTFCGLNGTTMRFRAKSPERVLSELATLSRRYRCFNFEAVDNIVDQNYFKHFFPVLASEGRDYQFFYEIKSNLTRAKLKMLGEAGVRSIQPGIESLSTPVLALMRKGVSAAQNVNTLRWASYYGIHVGWNLLYGFPGESEADYAQQLALLAWLRHLQPPEGCGRIWMERYSLIFTDRASFPARYVRPEASYAYVYPAGVQLERIAYFFEHELEHTLPEASFGATVQAVHDWRAAWAEGQRPALRFWSSPGYLHIEDQRRAEDAGSYTFEDDLATLYVACSDAPRTPSSLCATLGGRHDAAGIAGALDEYCARGLMMHDQGSYLSLALPANPAR